MRFRLNRFLCSFALGAILASLALIQPVRAADRPPNLILILADDLGWGDLGSYGARGVETPHLDRMAAEGVRFTDFYSVAPICSPARAALLTGRYPRRVGISAVLRPGAAKGLPARELTLAELLRVAGYATGIVGKWHLGDQPKYLPASHGFDFYFGIPYSNDMMPLVYVRGDRVVEGEVPAQPLLTGRYTKEAKSFIRRHSEEPFFLFLSHSMPHLPLGASARWKGTSSSGIYGDVIQELDWSVGEILFELRRLGLDENTALFFTSDNGSWRGISNGILRGRKASTWEGGVRVPLLARYRGVFPAGREANDPGMIFDLFTTLLELAQIPIPEDRPIDGLSLMPQLRGQPDEDRTARTRAPDEPLFFFNHRSLDAVRVGPWKLHVGRGNRYFSSRDIPPELYNLIEDPGERMNLASQHPALVERLQRYLESFEKQLRPRRNR